MRLLIEPLLKFYDDPLSGDNQHSNAVTGVIGEDLCAAVFKKYLLSHGFNDVKILDKEPKQKKGKWLDRWIYATRTGGADVAYQCEIKNWAASSSGGKRLPVECTKKQMSDVVSGNWKVYNKDFTNEKKQPNGLSKVLLPMMTPEDLGGRTVEPLLLYWMPISNVETDAPEPFFSVPVRDFNLPKSEMWRHFERLNFFSTSLYLRRLLESGKKDLTMLDMPDTERRVKVMKEILDL